MVNPVNIKNNSMWKEKVRFLTTDPYGKVCPIIIAIIAMALEMSIQIIL